MKLKLFVHHTLPQLSGFREIESNSPYNEHLSALTALVESDPAIKGAKLCMPLGETEWEVKRKNDGTLERIPWSNCD